MRGPLSLEQRARWLHSASCRVLRSLEIEFSTIGQPPERGIIVANHLSYLDIAILSATTPCFFVAKHEIRKWPYFGWAAQAGGTLFLNRSSFASAERVAHAITERLSLPVPTLFFPEGTSTDGSSLLPFHRRLFEPAVRARADITPAAITYRLDGGAEERELCWYGDQPFLPHLWKALAIKGFTARVSFAESRVYPDRRTAAAEAHATIRAMRARDVGSMFVNK